MNVLRVKNYKDVDLNNSKEALDYLIYLTEDSRRLINLTLAFGLEKIVLTDFYKSYYECEYIKSGYLIQYPYEFYDRFVKNDSFIFDSYFFDNTSASDIEKIAKINRLVLNLKKLLEEIREETQTEDLEFPEFDNTKQFISGFEKKFPDDFITYNYLSDKPFRDKQYPYKLLLFYFGVKLNKIYKKIITNYIGFIKDQSIEKHLLSRGNNSEVSKNYFSDMFKSNDIYEKFINYTNKHIIEPYRDYSYLFQRLKKDELIYDMKHKKFIDWLLTQNLISKKDYNTFIDNGGFRSYSKSFHVERENNFNNIFSE
jgi:hypothetical protein